MSIEIGKNTFARHLWDIYRNGYSGILRAERKNLWKEVYFAEGVPVGAKSNILKECLGRLLVEFGKLNVDKCEESLILMKGLKKKQGEALVKMGFLEESQLPEMLRFQLRVRLLDLFKWEGSNFRFASGEVIPSVSLGEEAGEIILDGIRGRYQEIKKELMPFEGCYIKKTGMFPGILDELCIKILPADVEGKRVKDLIVLGKEPVVFLYTLVLTGAVEIGEASENMKILVEFYKKIEGKNHFEVLGISPGAKEADVKRAYYNLAKLYHPDLYENASDKKIVSIANNVFCLISSAYEVLSYDKSRREYEEQLRRGVIEGDSTSASRILLAEMEFKKGQGYLRVNNFKDAVKSFQTAVNMNPEEGEFYAYLGWAMYNMRDKTPEDAARAREYVSRAISMNPRIAKAYYFIGFIYRVEGNIDAALREFDRALRYDPNLIEPLREMRLINTRISKEAGKKGEKGIFGKIFK